MTLPFRRLVFIYSIAVIAVLSLVQNGILRDILAQTSGNAASAIPRFEVDRSWQWPPKLPNNWGVGIVSFVAVDRQDHVPCVASISAGSSRPARDHQDSVWITGMNPREGQRNSKPSQRTDDMILKFTNKGKLIAQFGGRDRHPPLTSGSHDKITPSQTFGPTWRQGISNIANGSGTLNPRLFQFSGRLTF